MYASRSNVHLGVLTPATEGPQKDLETSAAHAIRAYPPICHPVSPKDEPSRPSKIVDATNLDHHIACPASITPPPP
jgi:hypothetical protein